MMRKLTLKKKRQRQFVLLLFVGFLVVAFLTGCTFTETMERRMLEMQQQHITEWHQGAGITNEIKSES